MSEAKIRIDVDVLAEQILGSDVACHECGKPALLRSDGHGCASRTYGHGPWFKCLQCWQKWFKKTMAHGIRKGHLTCEECRRQFRSIAAFSDYREF